MKCKSTAITISWTYAKKDEMGMLLSHDGWGLQYEDAIMKCADCNSRRLSNLNYDAMGNIKEQKK